MKKNVVIVLVILTLVFGLSGCGSDSPEDVAVEFVKSMSNFDLVEAKELSVNDKSIKELEKLCVKSKAKVLAQETYKYFNNDVFEKKFQNLINSVIVKAAEEIGLELPYTLQELEKMSNDEQEKAREEMFKGMSENEKKAKMDELKAKMNDKTFMKEKLKESIDILEIKGDNSSEIKKLLIKMSSSDALSQRGFSRYGIKLATEVLLEQENSVDEACLLKYTSFTNVDNINVIESKNHSIDEVTVKLEIINKDKKSEKVSIELEKVQDEWKVTNPSFNISMWSF